MVAARIGESSKERYAYQTGPYRAGIDNEITQTCVPAGHEQLCTLYGSGEDHEEDREQTTFPLVTQTKCKSSSPINQEMLEAMGRSRYRTEGRRNHRQHHNRCRQRPPD